MTELVWEGKYQDGKRVAPVRIPLPFQTVETVNESGQVRAHNLELWTQGQQTEWRNRLIWGDKKYVLPSLLPEFAGKVNLIYIDPPFATGADFSFIATIPETDDSFTKEPSMIEQKAYRDTWGGGWTVTCNGSMRRQCLCANCWQRREVSMCIWIGM
jgi:adenine-specific DNA-methyltransferase